MVANVEKPPTISEIAASRIRQSIFSAELQPGQPLREAYLMEALDVSRTTVREALLRLQDQGLVEITPHHGASVVLLSCRDVAETYALRALLEPYAARLAFDRGSLDKDMVEGLRGLLCQMQEAEDQRDLEAITRMDVEFHYTLCEASDNGVLLGVFRNILFRTRLCILHVLLSGAQVSPNAGEHYRIIDAIEGKAPMQLAGHLYDHNITALDSFLGHFSECTAESMEYRKSLTKGLPW